MLIGIDVDEVCADMLTVWVERYNQMWGDKLDVEDVTDWDLTKFVVPECGRRIYDILHQPDFYKAVQPIAGALYAVRMLRKMGHEVVFISACTRGQYDAKLNWLITHQFLAADTATNDFIATRRKGLVGVDLLIDDNAETVNSFPRMALLVRMPHNDGVPSDFPRIDGLWEAPRAVALMCGMPAIPPLSRTQ